MTVYILIAIRHEERDLVGLFGADYEDYRGRAGMLIPSFGRADGCLEQPQLRAPAAARTGRCAAGACRR